MARYEKSSGDLVLLSNFQVQLASAWTTSKAQNLDVYAYWDSAPHSLIMRVLPY